MKITKDLIATIDYTLKDDLGEVLDTSENGDPLAYLHGYGSLIPGLEKKLEGLSAGDSFSAAFDPSEGYGEYKKELELTVDINKFDDPEELEVGMHFQAEMESGVKLCTVTQIDGDDIHINANHPLAGMTLHFDITIRDVREALPEEIEHGHVHGTGGHHH